MRQTLQRGFTMVEMMVVLVILGILAAIAIPNLTAYLHLSQFRKNESFAKSMYLSAESNLTYRRTGGEWEALKQEITTVGTANVSFHPTEQAADTVSDRIYALRLDAGEYGSSNISADGQLVVRLLEDDTYDKSILNEAICIEIDVVAGQVYSVFYGTNCDGLRYASETETGSGVWLDLNRRDYDTRRAERLGYYSVQDVSNVVDLELTKLKITSISLVNSETLSLNWSTNSKLNDRDVKFTIKLYEKESRTELLSLALTRPNGTVGQVEATVSGVGTPSKDYTFPLTYTQEGRFVLTLDAMMTAQQMAGLETNEGNPDVVRSSSTSITRFGESFQTAKDIYATVQAFPNTTNGIGGDYTASSETSSNDANTLYADGATADEASITTFRHLSNLRYGQAKTQFTVATRSLDWTSDNVVLYHTGTQNGVQGVLLAQKGSEVGFPTIPELKKGQSLNGSGSLLSRVTSVFTGGNAIRNLRLDENSVGDSAPYLGLFGQNHGKITGMQLVNAEVRADSGTLLGVGALCGSSDGDLTDSTCNTNMNVTLTNPQAQGIGGVAGQLLLDAGDKADSLSASGEIHGTLPTGDSTSGIGGIAGSMTAVTSTVQLNACENTANVTGNLRVGGVAGYVKGTGGVATSNDTLQSCSNEGLILCSVTDGRCIGGVVGYGNNAKLNNCTSRAGSSTAYTKDKKDQLLRGDYVGGILGYGQNSIVYHCATQAGGYVLGRNYVGGIAGTLKAGNAQEEKISTDNQKVTTNASYVIGQSYVGGIIGQNSGTSISNCVNTGVAAGYGEYIGGICGRNENNATIKNCASYVSDTHNTIYNMVVGWGATGDYAGGLVGYNNGSIVFNNNTNNYVTTKSVASIVVGKNYVGGMVGFNDTNAAIDVNYTVIGGRVAATGDCVGGLIGLNASLSLLAKKLTIQPSSVQGKYYVGGAIGANVMNLTQNTELTGLTVDNSLGTVTAQAFCGGLIGYQRTYAAGQDSQGLAALLPGVDTNNGNVPTAVAASASQYMLTISGAGNTTTTLTKASNNMTIRAYAYAGGIVGYCEGHSKLLLKNCLNEGAFDRPAANAFPGSKLKYGVDLVNYLRTQGYETAAQALSAELNEDKKNALRVAIVGGVMGVSGLDHVIDHCGNTGVMNGQAAMGGVVGLNEGLVTHCTLSGSMGSANQDYVGGIAGLNVGGKNTQSKTYDNKTYQAGTITTCSTQTSRTVTGGNTVGGIVGYNLQGGTVQDTQSSATVTGTSRVGGIAGENGGTVSLAGNTAENPRTIAGSGQGVGGILGVNTATGQLTTGTTTGDAVVTDQSLTVTGQSKVGGIAGINRGRLGGTEGHSLTNNAKLVRATQGLAGGVVGAQEGTNITTVLSYAKNLGEVIANKGTAGGIVGQNGEDHQVQHCVNAGDVTSNNGYAGGVVSENYGTIADCSVNSTDNKVTLTQRGQQAQGAICAVNHTTGTVTGSILTGDGIDLQGEADTLGAIVGKNTGKVSNTTVTQQPNYNVSASALTVGGAVGLNTEGGTVQTVKVTTDFQNFSNYHYLGGVVGENAKALTQGNQTKDTTVTGCTYTGTIDESTSAVGNCYGGIAGLNRGLLDGNTVSNLTVTATGVYTATSTSTAAQKEALSSHIGGIAGKNETTGTIRTCYISDQGTSKITVQNGMVGGVTGYNKGTITHSGDASTEQLMQGVTKVSELLKNAEEQKLSADATWVQWDENNQVEEMQYNNGTALENGRTMQLIVSSNGNLGGVAGYNSPTGEMSYCASGNWLLVNKSGSIGVGTGGMIGMNETEKDLTFLLNRAFVGRQLSSGQTNRFAGGIIGNQNNSTTSSWLIKGCVNYGTVYGYKSHYSGGIIGQWTNNGGTVEGCYNYGNLQTSYKANWVGASAGIVAQLYHAASYQEFNIISCQNHGSIYGTTGMDLQAANDSAGILGNVTAYGVSSESTAQKYTINVTDCVNGPGVRIYSGSMASGIVGFFSGDTLNASANASAIGKATQKIVLNIDRCRNYSNTNYLQGSQFRAGIFGDRYGSAKDNTYIQNCYSLPILENNGIISFKNGVSSALDPNLVGNNYYFEDTWGLTINGTGQALSVTKPRGTGESRRGYARMLAYGVFDGTFYAAIAGPRLDADLNVEKKNDRETTQYGLYWGMTEQNTTLDHDILHSTENGQSKISGRVLFQMPQDYGYDTFKNWGASTLSNEVSSKTSRLNTLKGGKTLDDYVREGYRTMEYDQSDNTLGKSFGLNVKQNADGSFDVEITDNDRPLYYEGEVYIAGQDEPILTNLRFIPSQKGQGQWDPQLNGTQNYGSGVTTGSFRLPEELAEQTAGQVIRLKVRAVSLFEDTQPSEWESAWVWDVSVMPTPEVSLRLSHASGSLGQYTVSLKNENEYQAFTNWNVSVKVGSSSVTLNASNPTRTINGVGLQELTATATAGMTNGITPTPATTTIPTYTPTYQPDAKIASLTYEVSGNTLDDLVISTSLKPPNGTINTPPIYRIELLGDMGTQETVFAYEDVLISANHAVTVNFRDLPKEIFEARNLRLRAWYAASGLGPVYTYGDTPLNNDKAVTYRQYRADGTVANTETYYSYVLGHEKLFDGYIKTTDISELTALPAPVLGEAVKKIGSDGSLSYTFSWDQGANLNNGARYTVRLMGVLNDGSQVGISTADDYTKPSDRSFTINADDWKYSRVILTVTRVGSGNQIGLSASREYPVSQRLERPGQPVVSNPDTNELKYNVSWSALADETGCGEYQLIAALGDATAELADVTASGQSSYAVSVDLEPYAGQRITLYLVAKGTGNYADSPNGVSYVMTVPSRVKTPTVQWSTNFTYDTVYSMADFQGGKLTVSVTPDADSIPPGGSTYLLRAVIYGDAACNYPGNGQVSAMSANGGKYTLALNNLYTGYAGKWIKFQTRISSAAGQVSSVWVTSRGFQLPKVQLNEPDTGMDYRNVNVTAYVTATPDLLGDEKLWSTRRTVVTWPPVPHADAMILTLNGQNGNTTTVRVKNNADGTGETGISIEILRENAWNPLTIDPDGYYHLTAERCSGRYTPSSSSAQMTYRFDLETLLRQESDGSFTLILPNCSTLATDDGQTLTSGRTLMKSVSIQSTTQKNLGGTDAAYVASGEKTLSFVDN